MGGGGASMAAIKTDGTLWMWGNNANGQLAQGNKTQYSSPVQVPGTTWKQYSGGLWNQSFAIKTDGTLWSWGYGTYGGLAQNNTQSYSSPRQVGSDTNWAVVSQSYYAVAMATKTDGTLWAWGSGAPGSLANNMSGPGGRRSSPIQIPGTNWGTTINDIVGGEYGNFARKTDGTLWAWGMNNAGKLGQNEGPGGNSGAYSSPVQIPGTWDGINVLSGRSPIAYKNL